MSADRFFTGGGDLENDMHAGDLLGKGLNLRNNTLGLSHDWHLTKLYPTTI
jgi:hypothetical protein